MTKTEAKPPIAAANEVFANSPDGLRALKAAILAGGLRARLSIAELIKPLRGGASDVYSAVRS
jgi:hypothetical protein